MQYKNDLRKLDATTFHTDLKISAIVMNHNRPELLRPDSVYSSSLLPSLINHTKVDQILLLHSNPLTKFQYNNKKVTNIDAVQANKEIGLAIRFQFCASDARNNWILLADDDMEFEPSAIDTVLKAAVLGQSRNKTQLIGKYGRSFHFWTAPFRNGYHTHDQAGHAEVILTKFLLIPKHVCRAFMKYKHIVNDVVAESSPMWNGEDIFASLVSNHLNARSNGLSPKATPFYNWAIRDLDVWEAVIPTTGSKESVSGNIARVKPWQGLTPFVKAFWKAQSHASYRGRLWSTAKNRLASLAY